MTDRRRDLAKIHLGAAQLGMDEADYRAMLLRVTGQDSSANLDAGQRRAVLDELRRLGWRPRARGRTTPSGDRQPLAEKIQAMLRASGRPPAYADGMARRMYGIERYEWCDPTQLRGIVAALEYDRRRHPERWT